MSKRILAVLALVVLMGASPFDGLGQTYLDNVPVYHGVAQFHWTLLKKPRQPVLGVFCKQGTWVYIAELGVSQALTGDAGVIIASEVSSALPGHIDYTQPSDCQAYMWDERLVAQNKPAAIAAQVFFTIEP